jgi:hypothetical protein
MSSKTIPRIFMGAWWAPGLHLLVVLAFVPLLACHGLSMVRLRGFSKGSRVTLIYLPGSVGVACSPIWSVSFEGMGCEPVLNLAATTDEAVSIICTVVDKTILLTLWGKLMYVSYTTDWPVFSRASRRRSNYNLSLGSFGMVDLCLWDALSRWCSSWRVFYSSNVHANFAGGLGTSTHVCSWSITDCYIIKRQASPAWYWFWTIKALVEAMVLWWFLQWLLGA